MRYLFRGLRADGEGWVYGYYFNNPYAEITTIARWLEHISYNYMQDYEVIAETVGQWTGLRDKWEQLIFEGDNVKAFDVLHDMWITGIVIYKNAKYQVEIDGGSYKLDLSYLYNEDIEVIGNIHEGKNENSNRNT